MSGNMYLADYHVHSRWSPDSHAPMAEMVRAARDAGLNEVCFTDHVEVMGSGRHTRNQFNWQTLEQEYESALAAADGQILVRLGLEFGEASRDFTYAEQLLAQMPPVDFLIGSQHQLSSAYGNQDLYFAAAHEPAEAGRQIRDYLEQVLKLAKWGKYNVLGHLTLPLRYMNENNGLHMTFDGLESEVEEIFRALIANGCGIEVNTNRGHGSLPGKKWIQLYRACGGEIITLGSDAHGPDLVGCGIREGQELLRQCGFTHFCTFVRMKPQFYAL